MDAPGARASAAMIGLPAHTQVWLAGGHTDLRLGFDGLTGLVQAALTINPCSGHGFVNRGKRPSDKGRNDPTS